MTKEAYMILKEMLEMVKYHEEFHEEVKAINGLNLTNRDREEFRQTIEMISYRHGQELETRAQDFVEEFTKYIDSTKQV